MSTGTTALLGVIVGGLLSPSVNMLYAKLHERTQTEKERKHVRKDNIINYLSVVEHHLAAAYLRSDDENAPMPDEVSLSLALTRIKILGPEELYPQAAAV
jgi:hypothetical protein